MSSYVVYGRRAAVAIHRSFACTREELGGELRRVAEPLVGAVVGWHPAFGQESADAMAAAYTAEKLKEHPLTAEEMRWINEGATAQMMGR
jgi:hypothetical protein